GGVRPPDRPPLGPFLQRDLGVVGDLVEVPRLPLAEIWGRPEHRVVRQRQLVHEIASCSSSLGPMAAASGPARNAATRSAVSCPWRMQSAIPIPRRAEPVTNTPGLAARATSIRATRSRCPTSYWGIARCHRITLVISGRSRSPRALP